jgi:chromosome segregation ATPase
MAEADTSLTQRVESLERTSHERVVEQVTDLGERVAGLESAREAENPHLATKADIARLETRIAHTQEQIEQLDEKIDRRSDQFQSKLDAQSGQFQSKLDAQSEQFQSKLDAQSEHLQKIIEQRINRMIAWLIATGIALAALILSRLPG